MRNAVRSAGLAIWLCTSAAALAQAQAQRVEFSQAGQDLSSALRDVAKRTGINLVAPADLVAGRRAPSLSGAFTPEQAIGRLLEGTGLTYKLVEGTFIVLPSGNRISEVALGKRQQPDSQAIVVTGTNVRGAPPTSPVIVISRREIEQAAPASIEELMRKLPQNLSSGAAEENIGVTGTGADITDHGAGVDLRGLGQRATLVLVNGRRIAPSGTGSFVDVSMIPVSALERVEVLTDGASAIYGSDAVGGVVNLILRKDFRGLDVMAQAGTTTRGGGDQLIASATAGTGWNSGQAMLSYEYRGEGAIKAGDRDFTINLPAQWSLFPREQRHSLFGTAREELSSRVSLELTGLYAQRHTSRSYFEAGATVGVNADAYARMLGGTAALNIDFGSSWRAQASASLYQDRTRETQLEQVGSGLVNRFDTTNSLAEFALQADGTLFELPGGPAKLAVGALSRREHYASVFETQVNTPIPQAGSRTVRAIYGELNLPIVGERNGIAGVERLTASLAGRAEHYQGIGSTFNPKIGLLWSPWAGLSLRGSYGTSFRAPLLNETLGLYNLYLFPASFLFIDPTRAPSGVGAALVGSNPAVKPERSRSFSAGLDWAPASVGGLRLSANFYAIRFSNRITFPSDAISIVGNPALEAIVTRNPAASLVSGLFSGAGQVLDFSGPGFTNGGASPQDVNLIVDVRSSNTAETMTSGLDLEAKYDFALGANQLHININANHVFRFDNRLTKTSPISHALNTPFNSVDWRARAGLSWERGPLSAWLDGNFTNSYHDTRGPVVRKVSVWTTFDGGVAVSGPPHGRSMFRNARVALVAQNLFDARPPTLVPDPGFTKGVGYDPVNASARGRMISLQVRKAW